MRNFEPIWGVKKDYNRSEKLFEEREKSSLKRTTLPQTSHKPEQINHTLDELSPLSKRLKIELRDINRSKKRNKETCDKRSDEVVNASNNHPSSSIKEENRQKEMQPGKISRFFASYIASQFYNVQLILKGEFNFLFSATRPSRQFG